MEICFQAPSNLNLIWVDFLGVRFEVGGVVKLPSPPSYPHV